MIHEHAMNTPRIQPFTLGPFQTNCYVISVAGCSDCWIIDCSFDPEPMIQFIRVAGLTPKALILTHAHADHLAGIPRVKAAFPDIRVSVHEAEREWLSDNTKNLSAMLGMPISVDAPDELLRDGDVLKLGETAWNIIHTPGHSIGGITIYHEESNTAIVGDTLFAGGIGRFDFPDSNFDTLCASIQEKLYTLPDHTHVFPGHGPMTSIGFEKANNPYVRPNMNNVKTH